MTALCSASSSSLICSVVAGGLVIGSVVVGVMFCANNNGNSFVHYSDYTLTERMVKLVRWLQEHVTALTPSSVVQPLLEKPPYPPVHCYNALWAQCL